MSSPRTLVALVALLALLALPSAAQAEPSSPILIGTNPESPNFSTTPQIYGRAGGVGTSVVSRAFRPITAASDPNSTITIYTDAACAGPVAATGTLSQLEGSGIPVAVAVTSGSTTEYFATQIDPDEPGVPSACSAPGLTYRQVSGPPPAPSLTGVSPASPADHNAPRLFGSAEAGATVSIYADAACAGAPLGAGGSVAFGSAGVEVFVADNSTTTFYAAAAWAGLLSGCSATSVTYQEVTAPPQDPGGQPEDPSPGGVSPPAPTPGRPAPPQLHTVPGGRANNAVPRVVGSAARAASFEIFRSEDCGGVRAAAASAAEFAAGVPVRVEPNSTTRFSAVAIDSDGERSRCSPEPVAYAEDSAAPVTRITFGPGVKTRKRTAVFRFADITGEPPGVSYVCKLDGRPWKACQSPWRVPRLGVKGHLVRVRATDVAGNQETAPAKRRFKVVGRS